MSRVLELYIKTPDVKNKIPIELFVYLVSQHFGVGVIRKKSGLYFERPVNGSVSKMLVDDYLQRRFFSKILINRKAKKQFKRVQHANS